MIKVIKFSADWCGPCKAIAPKFKEISLKEEFFDIEFSEIDIDKNQDLATQYKIRSIPTVIILKDDTIIERIVGNNSEKIEQAIIKIKEN